MSKLHTYFLDFDTKLICNLTGLMCVMNDRKDNISQYVTSECGCISNCGMYEAFLIGIVQSFKGESKFLTYVRKHILSENL